MEVAGFEPAWVFARHTRRINGPVLLTSQPHFQIAPENCPGAFSPYWVSRVLDILFDRGQQLLIGLDLLGQRLCSLRDPCPHHGNPVVHRCLPSLAEMTQA